MPKFSFKVQRTIAIPILIALQVPSFSALVDANPVIPSTSCHASPLKGKASCSPGNNLKLETWDTEIEDHHSIYAKNDSEARKRCETMRKNRGLGKLNRVINHQNGTFTSVFDGRQTNNGGGND